MIRAAEYGAQLAVWNIRVGADQGNDGFANAHLHRPRGPKRFKHTAFDVGDQISESIYADDFAADVAGRDVRRRQDEPFDVVRRDVSAEALHGDAGCETRSCGREAVAPLEGAAHVGVREFTNAR